jgi:hypothetical protein
MLAPPDKALKTKKAQYNRMDGTRAKVSAISRLLNILSQPRHDYRPATSIFLDLNTDRIAEELQLERKGAERGLEDRPHKDAQTFDDYEHQIVERIEGHKQDAHAIYLDQLHIYDERMTALNFEERFAVIRQAAPEAVGEFRAEAALGRDDLFALRRRLYESEQERGLFRKRHNLERPARISSFGKLLLKIGILAVLFVVEVVINGSFLAASNVGGLLGGAVQAVSFAALNIIASFLWGLAPIRLLNRRNLILKLLGLISLLADLAFAILLNLTLAHLREMPPTLANDMGQQVLAKLLHSPYVLNDVNSWVFFGIGFIFSLIAMMDGIFFTDPYPGYAALERRWLDASTDYTERKATLVEELRDIRDKATDAMNVASRDLSVRRSEFDAIVLARSRLAHRFSEHQNHIERCCNALLAVYHEANRKARHTPVPDYFSRPYKLERVMYAGSQPDESVRQKLQKSIEDTQDVLNAQVQAIHAAFDEAFRSYREIDELIPEK